MSVLASYLYVSDPTHLKLLSILPAIQTAVPWVVVSEVEPSDTHSPDWTSITLQHPKLPGTSWLFVRINKLREQKLDLAKRYPRNSLITAVKKARIGVWSQLLGGSGADKRKVNYKQLDDAFHKWQKLIGAIANISDAVVDLPESERLYNARQFALYAAQSAMQRLSWEWFARLRVGLIAYFLAPAI